MKKTCFIIILVAMLCLPLGLIACNPNSTELIVSPPKYIGFTFMETPESVIPAPQARTRGLVAVASQLAEPAAPIEITPDSDLNIVLLYENEKRDMIVDVIVDDSQKGKSQVYSATSQNNNIESIETVYSDERNTWITEVTLVIKSNNQPVNDRTIEVKETTFLRDLIQEGVAEIDEKAETVATYTILSKIEINGEALYGKVGDKTTIDEPSIGGREFIGFYYYVNSTKINFSPDDDGKYEFLNKPLDLLIEWENLSYKIEYIVDGERYGEIETFTFSGSNNILRSVSVKSNVAGTRETGEYFDGWYMSSTLLGERITNEESIAELITKSDTEIIIKLYGQKLHSRFDPDRNFFTYKSAQEYGYDGYSIAFNYDTMFDNKNTIPQLLVIPAVVLGKKIDVIEGLKDYWQPNVHAIFAGLCVDLTISDGIKLIVENALKGIVQSGLNGVPDTVLRLPNDIIIDDPNFGNWVF